MGYILEMQQKGDDKWERCNDFLVPVLSYTVRGLKEGKSYTFRVKAENAAGVSEPSRNTPFIKALNAVGKKDEDHQKNNLFFSDSYLSVSFVLTPNQIKFSSGKTPDGIGLQLTGKTWRTIFLFIQQ